MGAPGGLRGPEPSGWTPSPRRTPRAWLPLGVTRGVSVFWPASGRLATITRPGAFQVKPCGERGGWVTPEIHQLGEGLDGAGDLLDPEMRQTAGWLLPTKQA